MHLMTRRIGGLTLTAMAGFSNNNYSAPLGRFLNGGKEMYARLDKLREDLQKAIAKRDEAEKKVKQLQAKLKEEENQQIVSDVASYNLTPEQLAQFLQLAGSGKLQELLNGQVKMPEPVTMNHAGDKPAEDEENLFDENEEDDQDEDN